MSIFFTADTHFFHRGAISKAPRPWAGTTVESMNEALIGFWNHNVQPEDVVYHLGDLSFSGLAKTESVVRRLHGNIRLVPGNHDDRAMLRKLSEMGLIELLPPLFDLKLENARITLCHYPLVVWNLGHRGALHLHGHCHGNLPENGARRTDVGVDGPLGPAPVLLQTVLDVLHARPGEYPDHHQPSLD